MIKDGDAQFCIYSCSMFSALKVLHQYNHFLSGLDSNGIIRTLHISIILIFALFVLIFFLHFISIGYFVLFKAFAWLSVQPIVTRSEPHF